MSYPADGFAVTVTTAGNPVPLASKTLLCRTFLVQAIQANNVTNTGAIVLGTAALTKSTGKGVMGYFGQGAFFSPPLVGNQDYDLSQVYLDAYNNGDGVIVTPL